MKANTHIAEAITRFGAAILLGSLALTNFACSSNSKPRMSSNSNFTSSTPGASVRPAVLETSQPVVEPVVNKKMSSKVGKPSAAKSGLYRSRDYGVSFVYPWQYAFVSGKMVANGDESLRPKLDGHDGQFTLARVEIPKGFYADTTYESGYFTLSLNQELTQEECESALGNDGKLESETINGIAFRWLETDSGGHGHATKLRQYVSFTNGTCYEVEMGVKTSNEDGQARDVNPDQVLRRLDGILRTVQIVPETPQSTPAVAETPKPEAIPGSQE